MKFIIITFAFFLVGCGSYNINSRLYKEDNTLNNKETFDCIKENKEFIPDMDASLEKNIYNDARYHFGYSGMNIISNKCKYVYKIYKKTFLDKDIIATNSNNFMLEKFLKSEKDNYGVTVYKMAIARESENGLVIIWEGIYQNELLEKTILVNDSFEKEDSKIVMQMVDSFLTDTQSKKFVSPDYSGVIAGKVLDVAITYQFNKSLKSIYQNNSINNTTSPKIDFNINP